MATNIILAGVSAGTNAIGILPPVSAGLVAWFWPGTDAPTTARNWLIGGSPATIVGSPTYAPGIASLKSFTNYLQTPIPETNDMTFFVVARSLDTFATAANRPVLAGFHTTGSPLGALLYVFNTTPRINLSAAYNTGSVVQLTASVDIVNFTSFKYIWGRINSGANTINVVNQTDGSSPTPIVTTGTRTLIGASNTLRIGSSYDNTITGTLDMAHCSIYNRALSDTEVATHYAFVKQALSANLGIPV